LNLSSFPIAGLRWSISVCGSGAFKTGFAFLVACYAGWMGGDEGGWQWLAVLGHL